jgi:hypothetical protein
MSTLPHLESPVRSGPGSVLTCALGVGFAMGLLFLAGGWLLGWIHREVHDVLELSASGFAVGFVSALLGLASDSGRGTRCGGARQGHVSRDGAGD